MQTRQRMPEASNGRRRFNSRCSRRISPSFFTIVSLVFGTTTSANVNTSCRQLSSAAQLAGLAALARSRKFSRSPTL